MHILPLLSFPMFHNANNLFNCYCQPFEMALPFPSQLPEKSPLICLSLNWLCLQLPICHHSWSNCYHPLQQALAGADTAKNCRATKRVVGAHNFSFLRLPLSEVPEIKKEVKRNKHFYDKSFERVKGLSSILRGSYQQSCFLSVMFLSLVCITILCIWCCSTTVDPPEESCYKANCKCTCLLTSECIRLVMYCLRLKQ